MPPEKALDAQIRRDGVLAAMLCRERLREAEAALAAIQQRVDLARAEFRAATLMLRSLGLGRDVEKEGWPDGAPA